MSGPLLGTIRFFAVYEGVSFVCQFQSLARHDIWRCGKCETGIVGGFKGPNRARLFTKKECAVCHSKVRTEQL